MPTVTIKKDKKHLRDDRRKGSNDPYCGYSGDTGGIVDYSEYDEITLTDENKTTEELTREAKLQIGMYEKVIDKNITERRIKELEKQFDIKVELKAKEILKNKLVQLKVKEKELDRLIKKKKGWFRN